MSEECRCNSMKMCVELIKEQQRENVAAPWPMWDTSPLLLSERVPPRLLVHRIEMD
jgi:hypothetical protein